MIYAENSAASSGARYLFYIVLYKRKIKKDITVKTLFRFLIEEPKRYINIKKDVKFNYVFHLILFI